jgi:monoterpene epsilon-lactone hydrolase
VQVCSQPTLAAYAGSDAPKLIVLVHGGMFVTGSPRAGRHLAAKLSDLTGLPVVTPTLRLAPEHQYPAALDDLRGAYTYLTTTPIGGSSAKPAAVGVFAESSGGALLLQLLSRADNGVGAAPSALVLASPWLDMTCSSASYLTNESRDPVMQRKRLIGIAKAYLPEETPPGDPSVSPILGAAPSLLGLPPTFVQVGSAEVLVDESIAFASLAEGVGGEVEVQTYDGVLHAWHTFFPLM